MTDESETRRSRRAEQPARRRKRRKWPWITGGVLLVLVAAGAAAVSVAGNALTVKDELEASRPLLSSIKEKVLSGQAASAQPDVDALQVHVDAAKEATAGPLWGIAEAVPVLGENFVAVRTITDSVDDVVEGAVVPAVGLGDSLSPAVFKPVDGAINLAAIESVLPVLDQAGTALTSARDSVHGIKGDSLIGPVKSAVEEISTLVDEVEPAVATAKEIAPSLPALLGGSGPVNYLLVFENSAEVRPLGGIAGAQILITADQGRVSIAQEASGREFAFESEAFADEAVGPAARDLFLVPFGLQSQNNTLTPRVEIAADLTRTMWERQRAATAPTVVFVDPIALSWILEATGPVGLPDGTELTSANAVDVLLNQVYQRFDTSSDQDLQDDFFSAAAGATFSAIMSGNVDVPTFIQAVQRAGEQRRIVASSTDETVQSLIADAGVGGRVPAETDTTRQIGVYFSDYLGSKMDYYLRTKVALGQAQCTDGSKRVRVETTASNIVDPAAVPDLSIFITGNNFNQFGIEIGDLRVFSYIYAPPGSTILSVTGTTTQEESYVGSDGDYPVARGVIVSGPGESASTTVDIDVSALPDKQLEALVGPMLADPEVSELAFSC